MTCVSSVLIAVSPSTISNIYFNQNMNDISVTWKNCKIHETISTETLPDVAHHSYSNNEYMILNEWDIHSICFRSYRLCYLNTALALIYRIQCTYPDSLCQVTRLLFRSPRPIALWLLLPKLTIYFCFWFFTICYANILFAKTCRSEWESIFLTCSQLFACKWKPCIATEHES